MYLGEGAEEGELWVRKPLREDWRGVVGVYSHGAPTSAVSQDSAIWLADVACSQPLGLLGNEQDQERAQGLLQHL